MASTASVVMSATQTSSRAGPTAAVRRGAKSLELSVIALSRQQNADRLSRPFGLRLGLQVDGAAHADIVEMLVEKTPRRALAAEMQHVEEIVIGRQLAESIEMRAETIEHDAVHVDAPVLSGPGAARQPALIDQPRDEIDGADIRRSATN